MEGVPYPISTFNTIWEAIASLLTKYVKLSVVGRTARELYQTHVSMVFNSGIRIYQQTTKLRHFNEGRKGNIH